MAFVFRAHKNQISKQQPDYSPFSLGPLGRDILSEISVDLFGKRSLRTQHNPNPTHQLNTTLDSTQLVIGSKELERKEGTLETKKECLSSFFKSGTRRSLLGDLLLPELTMKSPERTFDKTEGLTINGTKCEEVECGLGGVPEYLQGSTLLNTTQKQVSTHEYKDTIDEFQKFIQEQEIRASRKFKYSGVGNDSPSPGDYNQMHNPSRKGHTFGRSKRNDSFQPPHVAQACPPGGIELTETQQNNGSKNHVRTKPKPLKRPDHKLQTASTYATRVWGDETDSEEEHYIDTTPGPGYYNPVDPKTKPTNPRTTHKPLNTSPKANPPANANPYLGPTTYSHPYNTLSSTGCYIDRSERFQKAKKRQNLPEPGTYNPRVGIYNDMITSVLKSGIYHFRGEDKRELFHPNLLQPGPGNYNIPREFDHNKQGSCADSLTFGTVKGRNHLSKDKQNFPGPDYYQIEDILDRKREEYCSKGKKNQPFFRQPNRFKVEEKEKEKEEDRQLDPQMRTKQVKEVSPSFKPFNLGSQRFGSPKATDSAGSQWYVESQQGQGAWNKKSHNILFQ